MCFQQQSVPSAAPLPPAGQPAAVVVWLLPGPAAKLLKALDRLAPITNNHAHHFPLLAGGWGSCQQRTCSPRTSTPCQSLNRRSSCRWATDRRPHVAAPRGVSQLALHVRSSLACTLNCVPPRRSTRPGYLGNHPRVVTQHPNRHQGVDTRPPSPCLDVPARRWCSSGATSGRRSRQSSCPGARPWTCAPHACTKPQPPSQPTATSSRAAPWPGCWNTPALITRRSGSGTAQPHRWVCRARLRLRSPVPQSDRPQWLAAGISRLGTAAKMGVPCAAARAAEECRQNAEHMCGA